MICGDCGFGSDDQTFCGRCGARLALVCADCGRANPAAFRFCGACGRKLDEDAASPDPSRPPAEPRRYTPAHLADRILKDRNALEGERKQVTVLFADVVSFTAIAERLDPEEVHGVMDRCFRILLDEVHRYEGTVNQFTGDGVMALFGAPVALEDAPERAVRAALGVQAAIDRYGRELAASLGVDFRMRIGIHTGRVVVGKIGDDLRMDYTAVGDTTNLAARLQAAAGAGKVLVSDRTWKLLEGRFVGRLLGPLALKGKSRPVLAHEVERARRRPPGVDASDRTLTPFVGRGAVLATLEALFEQADGGRGQMAFAVGEAGIGKSRLLHELRRRLAPRRPIWVEGSCVSFAQQMPLLPIVDLVKCGFGIEEGDGEAAIAEKIDRVIAAVDPALGPLAPWVRFLLSVDPRDEEVERSDPNARRLALFDALKGLTLARAAQRPVVVVVEDLHWIDQPSEEYLAHFADSLGAARVLFIGTYRPGYRNLLLDRSYATRLALQPLSEAESRAMTSSMFATDRFPAEIGELILAKAEGNPFFTEEVTKSLLEIDVLRTTPDGMRLNRSLSEIVIPDTIHEVIMARIDRLAEAPKRAIQVASVIGREFAARLLQRVADLGGRLDKLVSELRSLELIYEKSAVPELAYMFKHALTHDVAYESLLVARRKELHRTIGRAIEVLYADRLAEHWETLAHHFERGEDWEPAFQYSSKAGEKAERGFANAEASYFYDRALAAAERLGIRDERRGSLYEAKARVQVAMSEFGPAVESLRRALATASSEAARSRIRADEAYALLWAHEFDAATAAAGEAIEGASRIGDSVLEGRALWHLAFIRSVRGDLDGAEEKLRLAAELAEGSRDAFLTAAVRAMEGLLRNWRGEFGSALTAFEPIVRAARDRNDRFVFVQVASHYTIALGGAGNYVAALDEIARASEVSRSIGDKVWLARQWNTRGWLLTELGALDEAEEANRRCVEIARSMTSSMVPELLGNAEVNLADLALARGDLEGAASHLDLVASLLADSRNEWMAWRYGMHFRATAGELELARGRHGKASELATSCLACAERTRSPKYRVRARRVLADAHRVAGRPEEAAALLRQTVAEAATLGNPAQNWLTLLAEGRTLAVLGRAEEARQRSRRALAEIEVTRATLSAELASTVATSPVWVALAELGG